MKKIYIFGLTAVLSIILTGCGAKIYSGSNSNLPKNDTAEKIGSVSTENINFCPEGNVTLPNYGDPGRQLKNCFIEYPGEPTREDKNYYIVEDICGQFTKEFMENVIGVKIAKIEAPKVSSLYNCSYYLDAKHYVMLNLEYLNTQKQKTGNEMMGRKVEQSSKIPMENLVVYQEDGSINAIYLILGPEKFLSLRPSTADILTNDEFILLATRLAESIKNYK